MNKYILFLLLLTGLWGRMTDLMAQVSQVSLLESNGKIAVFCVETKAAKKGEVASEAIRTLFINLLDYGVEGIYGGRKMMETQNPKWRENFFKDKNPPYMAYVKGYQTEGEPLKSPVGDYQATVLVRVNIEFLIRQLKAYGIIHQ
ncbi:MAG: hypothetical protein IK126_02675 [Bacteroidales bacterium]|nr:hypothetical protein [Bacteroidales bacterium]